MKLFLQKNAKFSSLGLRPQTPRTAPPHCEFLATLLFLNASSYIINAG